jgi:ribosomal protein S18 acetylase RimI-like enzyme
MEPAEIIQAGSGDHELIVGMYNQLITPPRTVASLRRRLEGRRHVLLLIARLEQSPVGFLVALELKPDTHRLWLCGVLPEYRRRGVASQLLEAHRGRARERGYRRVRFECFNRHRAMLHAAVTSGFNIIGLRWDNQNHDHLVIFEKELGD